MKSRIPKFKSLEQERQFWQTHSATEFWDELTPVKVRFTAPRKKSVSVNLTGLEVRILQGILSRITRTGTHAPSHRRS